MWHGDGNRLEGTELGNYQSGNNGVTRVKKYVRRLGHTFQLWVLGQVDFSNSFWLIPLADFEHSTLKISG